MSKHNCPKYFWLIIKKREVVEFSFHWNFEVWSGMVSTPPTSMLLCYKYLIGYYILLFLAFLKIKEWIQITSSWQGKIGGISFIQIVTYLKSLEQGSWPLVATDREVKYWLRQHGLRTPNEAFFHQNPKNFGLGQTIWADQFWGVWGIIGWFGILVLWVPSPLFSSNQPLFLQKTKPLYLNLPMFIWAWDLNLCH